MKIARAWVCRQLYSVVGSAGEAGVLHNNRRVFSNRRMKCRGRERTEEERMERGGEGVVMRTQGETLNNGHENHGFKKQEKVHCL